ncbi:hypothetical protein Pst134EA_009121 [Puccinia striiformis f. sp. tritici]|uniref:hypothetical protein n=1 Tax=Puccinia striiformis f. sp. tritici TaxID=168172 RepID=UPI002008C95A|nr:hypothetical protein Pst134EA_009121 [Puccinia striiformis f. sp. tritici]KAH9468586.1 hypothetical protein Pst134EA_009121 [Puccinia striiformis f. sp. tritici]
MQFPTTTIVLLAVSGLATAAVPVINRFYCNHDQPHGFCGVKLQNKQWFMGPHDPISGKEPLTFDRCGFGKSDFCGDDYMVYLVQNQDGSAGMADDKKFNDHCTLQPI